MLMLAYAIMPLSYIAIAAISPLFDFRLFHFSMITCHAVDIAVSYYAIFDFRACYISSLLLLTPLIFSPYARCHCCFAACCFLRHDVFIFFFVIYAMRAHYYAVYATRFTPLLDACLFRCHMLRRHVLSFISLLYDIAGADGQCAIRLSGYTPLSRLLSLNICRLIYRHLLYVDFIRHAACFCCRFVIAAAAATHHMPRFSPPLMLCRFAAHARDCFSPL